MRFIGRVFASLGGLIVLAAMLGNLGEHGRVNLPAPDRPAANAPARTAAPTRPSSDIRIETHDAAERMIIQTVHWPSYAGTMGRLCGLRDEKWLEDLDTAAVAYAAQAATDTYPELDSSEFLPLASRHFDSSALAAREAFEEDGARKACAGLRTSPLLAEAERIVQRWRRELPALMRSLKPIDE